MKSAAGSTRITALFKGVRALSVTKRSSLDDAIAYGGAGFPIVPVHVVTAGRCSCGKGYKCSSPGKHPRTRHGAHDATIDSSKIRRWWKDHPEANIGMATGNRAGVIAVDIDPRHGGDESYQRLVEQLGRLRSTVRAITGGGGQHVLMRHPGGQVANNIGILPGIDIRGDGGFIVVDPSIHASGERYLWDKGRDPRVSALAPLPRPWLDWMHDQGCYREAEKPRFAEADEFEEAKAMQSESPLATVNMESLDRHTQSLILQAITDNQPTGPGERNAVIFSFARALKGIPIFADCDPKCLRPVVAAWHDRAKQKTSGSHGFDDTWNEFLYGWPRIRCPGSLDILKLAEDVIRATAHPVCDQLQYENPIRHYLVGLCAILQQHQDDRPFFLSSHKAAEIFSNLLRQRVQPITIHRMLDGFVQDGVLRLVRKGNATKANRYRFIWTASNHTPHQKTPEWLKTLNS